MKLTTIVFKPSCQLAFTKEEVELLMRLSASHYDAHCREVGQVGGFLFGLNNVFVTCEPIAVAASGTAHDGVTLNFREIDTLCKILEIAYKAGGTDRTNTQRAVHLREGLQDCLQRLNNLCGLMQDIH